MSRPSHPRAGFALWWAEKMEDEPCANRLIDEVLQNRKRSLARMEFRLATMKPGDLSMGMGQGG